MGHDPTKAFKGDIRVIVSDGPFLDREPVVINCVNPEHPDHVPSLKVYPDGAKCWGCGKVWSVYQFAADYWGCTPEKAKERIKSGVLPPPVVHTKPLRATPDREMLESLVETYAGNLDNEQLDYLNGRGITCEAITRAKLGYTGTAYSIPIYGKGGELQTIRYRRDDVPSVPGTTPEDWQGRSKYWGTRGLNDTYLYVPPLFTYKTHLGGDTFTVFPTVLCEGELDALLLAAYGIRAVSFTNGAGSVKPEMVVQELGDCCSVLICMDADQPGKEAASAARDALRSHGVEARAVFLGEYKDVTGVFQSVPHVFADWVSHLRLEFAV